MQVITANEFNERLDDLLDAVENDQAASVLIERKGKSAAMLLNAWTAERLILGAYAQGVLSRSVAMQQLGLVWYGELLQRMNACGIERPSVSDDDAATMQHAIDQVLGPLGASKASNQS